MGVKTFRIQLVKIPGFDLPQLGRIQDRIFIEWDILREEELVILSIYGQHRYSIYNIERIFLGTHLHCCKLFSQESN